MRGGAEIDAFSFAAFDQPHTAGFTINGITLTVLARHLLLVYGAVSVFLFATAPGLFPACRRQPLAGVPRHKPLSVGVVLLDLVPYPSEDMIAWPVSFDRIAEAHRRIEAGGLDGKLILCPERSP
jgi:hypothetical protein